MNAPAPSCTTPRDRRRAGFSLLEVVIATAITAVAISMIIGGFLWSMEQFMLCSKIAWSQDEAMRSSNKLTAYLRNARQISNFDTNHGMWVRLRMQDGSSTEIRYTNSASGLRDGRLFLLKTNGNETIIARGLTQVMSPGGFTTPVFTKVSENALRVAYRVAEPVASGGRAANDAEFAAEVSYGACLRNVTLTQ